VRHEQPDEIGPDFSKKIFEEKISHQKNRSTEDITLALRDDLFFTYNGNLNFLI